MAARWDSPIIHDTMIVTGGGSGIGRALALELAERGVTAYLIGRRADALEETASMAKGKPGKLIPAPADLKDETSTDEAFKKIEAANGGPIRAMAHCAASVRYEPSAGLTFETFSAVVGTTLFTAFNALNRWRRPLMEKGLDGVAVALTSPDPKSGQPGIAHSASGKSGIEGYVASVTREWKKDGIRINIVGPGIFPVEKSKEMWDRLQQEARDAGDPLDRYGELHEIVGPIIFLFTEAAGFMNNAKLRVDGGGARGYGPPQRYTNESDPGTRP
ncbi:MAG: SDR family oxidoreductase [Phenylobacterium sp.]